MPLGRILVIRGGAIGDFIVTLPVLAALRQTFPDVALDLLAYPHIGALAQDSGLVDLIHPIESRALAGFFARNGNLDRDLSAYFARCHVIFSYLFDPDEIFRDNVGRVTRAQFIQGPHRPDETDGVHVTEQLLKPLEKLAIFGVDSSPRLGVARTGPASEWIALHPGSGSPRKNWPEQNWASLVSRLVSETDFGLLVIGGEAEGARVDRLARRIPEDRRRLVRSKPLPEVARELLRCSAFVGHDSGISHLAGAIGLPVIALWGESNAEVWRPKGPEVILLRGGAGLAGIKPEAAFSALLTLKNQIDQCSPS